MRKVTGGFGFGLIFIAAVIICSACGSKGSLVGTNSSILNEPVAKESISASEDSFAEMDKSESEQKTPYEDDYEYLWDALRNTYPYLPYLEEQGVDVEDIYSRYAKKVKAIEDEDAFYGIIENVLFELKNFAHLEVLDSEDYLIYCYGLVGDDGTALYENDPYSDVVTSPKLSKRYQIPKSMDSYEQDVCSNPNNAAFVQYYSDCKTLYIKIPSFTSEIVERDRNIVYDNIAQYPDTENIIFDISGNGGGDGYYWMQNLVAPFGNDYEFSSRCFYKTSPIFEQYHSNWETKPVSELGDAPDWVATLNLDKYLIFKYDIPDENRLIDSNIKRWVLTSENVYSAAETFTCFCKTTGWATVVGTPTSGDGMHTSPILVLLPYSGIIVRFSDSVGENPDGTINAIRGTTPNVLCKKGETSLGRCLELIRND